MKIRGAIFDMDGTLTDSMFIWKNVASSFLKSVGKEPIDDVDRRFTSMSALDGVRFLKAEYNLPGDVEDLTNAINEDVAKRYERETILKPGAREFVEYLSSLGVSMCVATATDREISIPTIERLGIAKYFKGLITSREAGAGKDQPAIFHKCLELLGTDVSETAVFEDSIVAIRTAKSEGFYVGGVQDDSFAYAWDEVKKLSDIRAETVGGFIGKFE